MKFIIKRIAMLILSLALIYSISDYVLKKARENGRGFSSEGDVCFTRLLLALAIISISVFSYEAYKFNKQSKIKERNRSFILVFSILILVIVFGEYFMKFLS